MSFLLLVVGLIVAAIGLVTIGFGIPINAFSLGNTLIISGTIAVACGLILSGNADPKADPLLVYFCGRFHFPENATGCG